MYQEVGKLEVQRGDWKIYKSYINDMLVKSMKYEDHLGHFQQTFKILEKYKMMFNLTKFTFRVPIGNFLRHLVTQLDEQLYQKRMKENTIQVNTVSSQDLFQYCPNLKHQSPFCI